TLPPSSVSTMSVARRSVGSDRRSTRRRSCSPSTTSVAERGAMCSRSARSLSRTDSVWLSTASARAWPGVLSQGAHGSRDWRLSCRATPQNASERLSSGTGIGYQALLLNPHVEVTSVKELRLDPDFRISSRRRTVSAAEKSQARTASLRRIGRLFAPYKGTLFIVVVIIMASSIISMASPFLLRAVIDRALPQHDVTLLVWLVLGRGAVAAVASARGVVQAWESSRVGQQIMRRLRTDVFAPLQRQSLTFFSRTRTGEVQSRITNDIGGMQSVVTSTATSIA